ncbi:unnamed protein product [Polarella glacialis]|uniref:Secreted protein n=1 Tax=Polarella glacialis TaxID=89957 RepID=A0A813FZM9_POLGL|nr:unnamed protein product [Polarella glacialis]
MRAGTVMNIVIVAAVVSICHSCDWCDCFSCSSLLLRLLLVIVIIAGLNGRVRCVVSSALFSVGASSEDNGSPQTIALMGNSTSSSFGCLTQWYLAGTWLRKLQ